MKNIHLLLATTALAGASIMTSLAANAQTPTQTQNSNALLPPVPTTKILAIGHLTAKANLAAMQRTMRSEVTETVKLYLAGKIDNWYMRKDKPGVVFILNLSNPAEAHKVLEELPLGKAGLMEFDLTPMGPLAPLGTLLAPDGKQGKS